MSSLTFLYRTLSVFKRITVLDDEVYAAYCIQGRKENQNTAIKLCSIIKRKGISTLVTPWAVWSNIVSFLRIVKKIDCCVCNISWFLKGKPCFFLSNLDLQSDKTILRKPLMSD